MTDPIQLAVPTELGQLASAELRAELARGLTLTATHLARLGAVWAELERRGEDLSDLREGLAVWLPLIASGRLAAEAVVAFATQKHLLRALDGLPLERQRALAAGAPVEVIAPAWPLISQAVPLAGLTPALARMVFDAGIERTPEQQHLTIRPPANGHAEAPAAEEERSRRWRPRYDADAGTIHIGRSEVRVAELLRELACAAGAELPLLVHAEEYVVVRLRLGPEENRRLQEAAQSSGLPDWELARKALRAFGLI